MWAFENGVYVCVCVCVVLCIVHFFTFPCNKSHPAWWKNNHPKSTEKNLIKKHESKSELVLNIFTSSLWIVFRNIQKYIPKCKRPHIQNSACQQRTKDRKKPKIESHGFFLCCLETNHLNSWFFFWWFASNWSQSNPLT